MLIFGLRERKKGGRVCRKMAGEEKDDRNNLVVQNYPWSWSCDSHMTSSRYVLTVKINGVGKLEPIR